MSWWIYLEDKEGQPLTVKPFTDGGTYVLGGSNLAELNVTYNYGGHYRRVLTCEDGFKGLSGLSAEDALPILAEGIAGLGDNVSGDYWEPTEGNAKTALVRVWQWCEQSLKSEVPATLRVS